MFHMSEKPKIQEIQIIYHATTRWPLSGGAGWARAHPIFWEV